MTSKKSQNRSGDRPAPDRPAKTEQHGYQAEVARLLHLMVHSVYTEKDVFLRELISNASDALDKRRYRALTDESLAGALTITLVPDVMKRMLIVADTGIGMDREELIANLGTIARSGTRAFLETLPTGASLADGDASAGSPARADGNADEDEAGDEAEEAGLETAVRPAGPGAGQIGQFGIGFYSAFMVADRIEVRSRKAGSTEAFLWASDGASGFTISPLPADDAGLAAGAGTAVTLFLKDDALSYLEPMTLERIVETYSSHIQFPIELDDGEEPRQLNTVTALWARPRSEISADEYQKFYQQLSHAFDNPAVTLHARVEGRTEYTALLFVPGARPFDLFDPSRRGRVKLYVRRVFISDDADLLPGYLRFVRGLVDSQDMPLNLSREMLQNNATVAAMRKQLTSRVLSELKTHAGKDAAAFERLWENFGAVLKEGIYEDPERRDVLLKLVRFRTSAAVAEGASGWRSLPDYMAALRENQTAIYYLVGDDAARLAASPHLEGYRARGLEVLLLSDPVDAFWVTTALGFDGKPFKSVTQGASDLDAIPLLPDAAGAEPAKPVDSTASASAALRLGKLLAGAVSEVRVSNRLTGSAAVLVAGEHGPDRALGRLLERQRDGNRPTPGKPVLEINPRHALIAQFTASPDGERATDLAWMLLDQARILDGEHPADPAAFTARLTRLLTPAPA